MRREFFGEKATRAGTWRDCRPRQSVSSTTRLISVIAKKVFELFKNYRFDQVIHCAAQPSHDRAGAIPLLDFEVNAVGTVNLLEATRQFVPEAVFIFMSTNKVYGDAPNELPLKELPTRWDYARPEDSRGSIENCRIDRCLHSLFGASKTAADVNGPGIRSVLWVEDRDFPWRLPDWKESFRRRAARFSELPGQKSPLPPRNIISFGYKGKQVRDQIHSGRCDRRVLKAFAANPRPGEVYNLGGGRDNSASISGML